jgi:chromosome segregation ATPase
VSDTLDDYYAALDRLKQRKAKINNDAVALEAGRKKGSIKKSRPQFAELIQAIDEAQKDIARPELEATARLDQAKDSAKDLQRRLDEALARELSLVKQVFTLRKELSQLRGGNIIPIRDATSNGAGHTSGSMADGTSGAADH